MALSDEARVSVAEQAMERGGLAGENWHVPAVHMDDPRRKELHKPVHDFVNGILNEHGHEGGIRVTPKHWDLRNPGSGQAVTDGMNYIGLKGEHTNTMSLLHETAHILTGTGEGQGGHGPEFQKVVHKLYHDHISPEAAETFRGITQPQRYMEAGINGGSKRVGTYYHNTDADLNPGDEIVPASERHQISPWSRAPGYSPHHVYMYDHHADPLSFYENNGKHRYEVEPVGAVHRDPEFEHNKSVYHEELNRPKDHPEGRWDESNIPGAFSYVAPRARIVHKLGRFIPSLRVFTHTCGLDHRLWDTNEKLKPEVRSYILQSISKMWAEKYPTWSHWARIYFAGSEASEWTSDTLEGNNDFDVLVGVDYQHLRDSLPQYRDLSNQEITDEMNVGFRPFNGPVMLNIDGLETGPWDRTTFCNVNSYDIRAIKPYAAYDVGKDEWVEKPPHLPHWSLSSLDKTVQKVLRATDTLARDILKLPEPERTQQGAALFDAWHSDRSRAFSENGEGWYDIANLREKWLDQAGLWAQIVDCKHRFNQGLGVAGPNWSNTPQGYVAKKEAMAWEDFGDIPGRPRPKAVQRAGFAGLVTGRDYRVDHPREQIDHVDDHLAHFARDHSGHMSTWQHAEHGPVDLSHGVYATQSHVSQFHVDRFKGGDTKSWAQHDDPESDDDYIGHKDPMFVTHEGRLHAIEGHHRVAAALQQGQTHPVGWHYDLDKHPVVQNFRGDECPTCQNHARPMSKSASRADRVYGKGLNALFPTDEDGPSLATSVPWPQASQSTTHHTYDQDQVARSITHPHEFPTVQLDPRHLRATQPSLVRHTVKHFLEGGKTEDPRLGNDFPRVYRHENGEDMILTGHHRAATALVKGEPFSAKLVQGGWGKPRT